MVGPSDAEIHPAFSKAVSSSFFHPPSGPKASTTGSESTGTASFRLKSRSISERTIRVPASILRTSPSFTGSSTSGTDTRLDCSDAWLTSRRQRPTRFAAELARCFSVRPASTGIILATPSSVHFSIAHSMRSNLKMEIATVTFADEASVTASLSSNSTRSGPTRTIVPRRTSPPVEMSNSWPTRARSTCARCRACSPVRKAWFPETSSAIQRRRVIKMEIGVLYEL